MSYEFLFDTTPEEHYGNIIQSADPEQVRKNVIDYFRKIAIMEKVIEENNLQQKVDELEIYDNPEIDKRVTDLVLESMGNIVVNHER